MRTTIPLLLCLLSIAWAHSSFFDGNARNARKGIASKLKLGSWKKSQFPARKEKISELMGTLSERRSEGAGQRALQKAKRLLSAVVLSGRDCLPRRLARQAAELLAEIDGAEIDGPPGPLPRRLRHRSSKRRSKGSSSGGQGDQLGPQGEEEAQEGEEGQEGEEEGQEGEEEGQEGAEGQEVEVIEEGVAAEAAEDGASTEAPSPWQGFNGGGQAGIAWH